MEPSPRLRRPSPALAALAAFALGGVLTFILLRPGAPEAGDGDAPPAAVAGPVRLYGELARTGGGFAVHVRAVNGGGGAERCRVTATVVELRDGSMSRVVRLPEPLWTTEVSLGVRAGATAEARLAVPAGVARDFDVREQMVRRDVQLQASCVADEAVG